MKRKVVLLIVAAAAFGFGLLTSLRSEEGSAPAPPAAVVQQAR